MKSTCSECETSPGCGWCSDPDADTHQRCSSIKNNEEICPQSSTEKKFDSDPTILMETRKQKYDYDWVQLRPQKVQLSMNVGDVKYIDFQFMFIFNRVTFTHDFPENVEVKIFSTCDGMFPLQEIEECDNIHNGHTVKFYARITLKSCPANAADWKRHYEIRLRDDEALDVEFTAFCSCSCDKAMAKNICRNDKKVLVLKLNLLLSVIVFPTELHGS